MFPEVSHFGETTMSKREKERREHRRRQLIRFRDLQERGIVENWPQLKRLVDNQNFPSGLYLGPNSRAWFEDEVDAWLDARPTTREETAA
jgi:predicted DNA-binding transcriptional regulator AlpA